MLAVIGQTVAVDDFRWWQLEDESWVREDVIIITGDCSNIPEIE
ncbi:MAG: hypothetical protein Q9P01_04550 [Anaerolineae bacterium]|nr:hypothetical protein [Anaerolineae bacterium]